MRHFSQSTDRIARRPLLAFIGATVIATTTSADLLGIVGDARLELHDGTTWSIVDVYAEFSLPTTVTSVVFHAGSFSKAPHHNDNVACSPWLPPAFSPAYDSFVTIGGDGGFGDATAGDPNFGCMTTLNDGAGIFNVNPPNGQGAAQFADGVWSLRIARFTIPAVCTTVHSAQTTVSLSVAGFGFLPSVSGMFLFPTLPFQQCTSAFGDLNGDGMIDGADLGILLAAWGVCGSGAPACPADLNGDGVVDGADLGILLEHWSFPQPS